MSAKKFKFVSPGVFLSEIDNSQLPKIPGGVGPVVIGRTRRGPAMKPVKVSSFQEFVEIFGEPLPGNEGEDAWRDGNGLLAPSYAPYAAQAYLKADINSPVTVIRLAGVCEPEAGESGLPGWDVETAYGIFCCKRDDNAPEKEAKLIAILYGTPANPNEIKVGVDGTGHDGVALAQPSLANADGTATTVSARVIDDAFQIVIQNHDGSITVNKEVSMKKGSKFIRDVLNTNPVATSTVSAPPAGTLAGSYWLGETFEEAYTDLARTHGSSNLVVFAMKLDDAMTDFKSKDHQLSAARSGWVFPQHTGQASSYAPRNMEKLFRFHAIQEGEQGNDIHVRIENIKIAANGAPSPYGTFDVVVRQKRGNSIFIVDSHENLNLNPNSDNFIARRIGDQHFIWDSQTRRNKLYGSYPNNSTYIRVEMSLDVGENGPSDPKSVPFGFFGPIKPASHEVLESASKISAATATFDASAHWAEGSVTLPGLAGGSSKLKLSWPDAPHVTKASQGIELVARYVLGSTPYNKNATTAFETFTDVNEGMKDFLRRYSTFGHLTDQLDGISDDQTTQYSYIFSLDEVQISGLYAENGTTTPGADLEGWTTTAVEFVSGSHAGTVAQEEVVGVAAQTTLTLTQQDPADDAALRADLKGHGFTLTDNSGNPAVPFFFDDTTTTADGSVTLDGLENKVVIGIQGKTFSQIADQIKAAIEGCDGAANRPNLSITVGAVGNPSAQQKTLVLTQGAVGASGNKPVTVEADIKDMTGTSSLLIPNFGTTRTGVTAQAAVAGVAGTSYTASSVGTAIELLTVVNSFSIPLAGGFDGVNITEADPFNMRVIDTNATSATNYAHSSVSRAIDLIKDPEALEMNLACMPGITRESLTTKLVQTCEARADALAIIDLPDIYVPPYEQRCTSFQKRVDQTSPKKSAKKLTERQINSSYGAAYYPWVKIRDTISSRDVWVPPSVVALGVMGYTEQRDEVWFAPAGFNRGGLNEGNAGLPVLQASEQLLSSDRDILYEANINPIASFVSEGLVVFGQKTLQLTPSALDRINVRRLLVFVKKEISRIANGLLFDQNVPATWNRFTGQVVPFLESVKTRLGLTDFKVVLDRTSTTPDLVDRNIMYAKIFLKPARAIEFIAVDFVITRSGASFDD